MIEVIKTYTGRTHWVARMDGIRELRCRVNVAPAYRCKWCGFITMDKQEAKSHREKEIFEGTGQM